MWGFEEQTINTVDSALLKQGGQDIVWDLPALFSKILCLAGAGAISLNTHKSYMT